VENSKVSEKRSYDRIFSQSEQEKIEAQADSYEIIFSVERTANQ